ncbi:MAG: amino acid-binding ACT domain-containing protein [Candidatus Lokiarchaeota archaeon]|nr:amino acid-binding ACT domain-containing protein [Candidatus Lokiarchaeota archaeon]
MKDMKIVMKNQPGMLADMGEILGQNNINMEDICGFPLNDEGIIHILVEDETTTKWVLEAAGFEVRAVREVLVMDVGNIAGKPGTGGKIARKIGDAGVNIDLIYFAENNKLVLGVDNLEKARAVIDKG